MELPEAVSLNTPGKLELMLQIGDESAELSASRQELREQRLAA